MYPLDRVRRSRAIKYWPLRSRVLFQKSQDLFPPAAELVNVSLLSTFHFFITMSQFSKWLMTVDSNVPVHEQLRSSAYSAYNEGLAPTGRWTHSWWLHGEMLTWTLDYSSQMSLIVAIWREMDPKDARVGQLMKYFVSVKTLASLLHYDAAHRKFDATITLFPIRKCHWSFITYNFRKQDKTILDTSFWHFLLTSPLDNIIWHYNLTPL